MVTIGVRPEKLSLYTSAPKPAAGTNVIGPGRVTGVLFTGVSTQYRVSVKGLGTIIVVPQNLASVPAVNTGAEVWLSWSVDHGFGLADDPADGPRFEPDTDTHSLAIQRREKLEAELEEA
jgi:spermidine/putrescine transport system ATP-binding protein